MKIYNELNLNTNKATDVGAIDFSVGPISQEYHIGRLFYDHNKDTLAYYNENSQVTVNIAQELLKPVINSNGGPMVCGDIIYPSGV